jgi:hypothetical protein
MCSLIGKEVGVVNSKPDIGRSVWFDLTAGDGVAVDELQWERNCSPGILAYHATNSTKPVDILLYEIKPATFRRLLDSLSANLPRLGYTTQGEGAWMLGSRVRLRAYCGSGSDADLLGVRRGDAVFAVNDPNSITDWAMRPKFAAEIGDRTLWFRSLSTMGCNTGGLKRLDIEQRRQWFDLLADQEAALPRYRDLLLTAIDGDDAQWAYLMSEPIKWKGTIEVTARSSFRRFNLEIAAAWYRRDVDSYSALKRHLFLTAPERKELA